MAALSTPPGEGGIAIVRVSGPGALEVAGRVFRDGQGRGSGPLESHTVRHGWVHHPASGERLDEVLVLYMEAPRSYTGEDVVEFQGHGGAAASEAVLEAVLAAGARLAEPGEFTRRAFLNGRLDLAQAEAVIELIRAGSEGARRAALAQLSGGLSARIRALSGGLLDLTAEVEACLDFDEEEVPCPDRESLEAALEALRGELEQVLALAREGTLYQEGMKVVLAGRPNVGKSSLLNALLGEQKAIVTPLPGTTRDSLEGWLHLGGVPLKLVDCAGIREVACALEREGVRRSLDHLSSALVVLLVIDGSQPLGDQDEAVARLLAGRRVLLVLNKSDLGCRISPRPLAELLPGATPVRVSCLSGQGLAELRERLRREAAAAAHGEAHPPLTANYRQREAAGRAAGRLEAALEALRGGTTLDAVAVDLRLALDCLGEITGETVTEDILRAVFSRFCVGK